MGKCASAVEVVDEGQQWPQPVGCCLLHARSLQAQALQVLQWQSTHESVTSPAISLDGSRANLPVASVVAPLTTVFR
jgi:hypothetical protein